METLEDPEGYWRGMNREPRTQNQLWLQLSILEWLRSNEKECEHPSEQSPIGGVI